MSKISAMSTKCPKQAIRSKMIRSRISAVGTVPSEVALDGDKHPSLFRLIPHFLQHALAKAPESQHVALHHLPVRLLPVRPVHLHLAGGDGLRRLAAAQGKAHRQNTVQPQGGHGIPQQLHLLLRHLKLREADGLHLQPYPAGAVPAIQHQPHVLSIKYR